MEKFDNLLDALKFADFPTVVRLYNTSEFAGRESIEGREVLLQRHMRIKYAQVKVLDFDNKDEIQDKKGIEFIMEHDNCVDNTFLIPSKYTASLKFIHRPGSWKRYASISQVLQELPRFVLVCDETIAAPSNGIGKNIVISNKTILEVIRKVSLGGIAYLECSDGKDLFSFRETDRVNFTEVEDEKRYNMYELVRLKLLPRTFQFKNVEPEDVVHIDAELNSSLMTAAEGPLELIKFVDVDVVVGWLRDNSNKTYKTFIIPSRLWSLINLDFKSFSNQILKENYIRRRYNKCTTSEFVEKSLYEMKVDETKIVWLASPDLYVRNYTGSCMFDVVPINYKDSEEEDVNYTYMFHCPPPISDRPSRLLEEKNIPTMHLAKVKEKQTLFAKVHKELLKWFIPKRSSERNTGIEVKEIDMAIQLQEKQLNVHKSVQSHTNDSENDIKGKQKKEKRDKGSTAKETSSQYLHPNEDPQQIVQSNKNIKKGSSSPNLITSEASSGSECDTSDSEASRYYDYIEPESIDRIPNPAMTLKSNIPLVESQSDDLYTDPDILTFDVPNSIKNNPAKGGSGSVEHLDRLVPVAEHSLSPKSSRKVSILNEREDEFYQYSVAETSDCLILCGLSEFAQKCQEYKLDGSFFRHFDFQVLKEEPFNLMSFHIVMIKKIILEGWRPKV